MNVELIFYIFAVVLCFSIIFYFYIFMYKGYRLPSKKFDQTDECFIEDDKEQK